ncbi:Nmad3 family putative nucleotide modification protein [Halomonas organivorans]|uniref:Nucleotide modification associated domain-containing protein n=1 Tax=Halomonas organivorans TaxID=257772 RepID=A0A7W5BWA9_9GAMM|nr:hypothetical protein [Halomonas organivorans]MBB3140019.1 hypothetical protein [Halomonas organivorans]
MKLILSRKGFDTSAGGVPNPILPDGRLLALPIPDARSVIPYRAITQQGEPLGPLVADLTRGRVSPDAGAHLDPDLHPGQLPRAPGWRPLFGQMASAQSHLRNQGVGPGDLFLFFGLFRDVERVDGRWRFVPASRPRHVLWGWLQVGEALALGERLPVGVEWAHEHPHCQRLDAPRNMLYIASPRLTIDRYAIGLPGAGIFTHYATRHCLTAPNAETVSAWELPAWFQPGEGRSPLTYHADPRRWRRRADRVALQAVARGQEFVLDGEQYPEAIPWARELIAGAGGAGHDATGDEEAG